MISLVHSRSGQVGSSSFSVSSVYLIPLSVWKENASSMDYSSFLQEICFRPSAASDIGDMLMFIANMRLAAAMVEGLNLRKVASRCVNLQYCLARAATCLTCLPFLGSSMPNSLRNLSMKWIEEIDRREKSSFFIIYSSNSINSCFSRMTECCFLSRLIILVVDGEMFSSSLAAIRMQTTAMDIKHGDSNPSMRS